MKTQDFALEQQVFNPAFMRKVWAKRRAAAKPTRRSRELMQAAAEASDFVPRKTSVQEIIREVAEKHGVPVGVIVGPKRFPWLIEIRHEAIATVAARRPDLSTTQIGREFGARDHTTVGHALRKHGFDTRSLADRAAAIATMREV